MKLNNNGLNNRNEWEAAGYNLPCYDRAAMIKNTIDNPYWIHFGAGNIFRAFMANVIQNLLNDGTLNRGLIVAEGYDYEIIEKMNRPHDDLNILVTLKADGNMEKTVIGSVASSLTLDSDNEKDYSELKEIFSKDSLQIVSFTITEKGYQLVDGKNMLLKTVEIDYKNGPDKPISYIGKVTSLLYHRYLSGQKPIAMVSMDNCSHNGTKLYEAVSAFAKEWVKASLAEPDFVSYIDDPKKVSFPWSMIDKITPRPDESVKAMLEKDGIEDIEQAVTSKNTYIAPFVNAEECEYLVIEDSFPNGKPDLIKGGLLFTNRETVDKVEKMKVCTCLNPLHTSLAIFGCLLGYNLISEEMKNPVLKKLVELIGYKEGLPVVVKQDVLDPKEFINQVLTIRIPNPFMPDTPQRIATDTSQKLGIRFGETIKAYIASDTLSIEDLTYIPLVFAGWLRYLMAIDDMGNEFTLSPDPMLFEVCPYLNDIRLYSENDIVSTDIIHKAVEPILSNEKIFGINLYEAGIAKRVEEYYTEMIKGVGAVRAVLNKYVI